MNKAEAKLIENIVSLAQGDTGAADALADLLQQSERMYPTGQTRNALINIAFLGILPASGPQIYKIYDEMAQRDSETMHAILHKARTDIIFQNWLKRAVKIDSTLDSVNKNEFIQTVQASCEDFLPDFKPETVAMPAINIRQSRRLTH